MEELVFDVSRCKDDYTKAIAFMYIVKMAGVNEWMVIDGEPDKMYANLPDYVKYYITERYPEVTYTGYKKTTDEDSRQKYYTRVEDDSCGGLGYSVVNLSTLTIVADFIDRDDAYRYASNNKNLWVHIDKAYVHQSMRPLREIDKCNYEPKHMSKETKNE